MAEVISLADRFPRQATCNPCDALIHSFSQCRRAENDVFWLKENAELLNILECAHKTEVELPLDFYAPFYDSVGRRISFFRQYYRFYLSICMDLEDLGNCGNKGERLAQWVDSQRLVDAELSDLQRGEAERLLARRNVGTRDPGLSDRLRSFMHQSARFAMPNIKIAYELTHIVFYLSEYGRVDPELQPEALISLHNVGTVAFLDQNMDLLAEVCIALRYAGVVVPEAWECALTASMARYRFDANGFDGAHDDYHAYFVGAWWSMTAGQGGFTHRFPGGAMGIHSAKAPGVMRPLSHVIYSDEHLGCLPWSSARGRVLAALPEREGALLRDAERSAPDFEQFYEYFARGGRAI